VTENDFPPNMVTVCLLRVKCSFNCTLCDIDAVESVQPRFTKRLSGLQGLSYDARLRRLQLQSIQSNLRRLLTDLVWCYKIIFGLVNIDVNKCFTLSPVSHTRGHNYKLYIPHSTGIHTNFFCVRVINMWNNLPAEVNFSTIKYM